MDDPILTDVGIQQVKQAMIMNSSTVIQSINDGTIDEEELEKIVRKYFQTSSFITIRTRFLSSSMTLNMQLITRYLIQLIINNMTNTGKRAELMWNN